MYTLHATEPRFIWKPVIILSLLNKWFSWLVAASIQLSRVVRHFLLRLVQWHRLISLRAFDLRCQPSPRSEYIGAMWHSNFRYCRFMDLAHMRRLRLWPLKYTVSRWLVPRRVSGDFVLLLQQHTFNSPLVDISNIKRCFCRLNIYC